MCFNAFLYCLITCIVYFALLGSGWLGCLALSDSPGLHTLTVTTKVLRISCKLCIQIVQPITVSLPHH